MASLPRCDPNRLRCVLNPPRPPRRAGQIPITLVSVGSSPVVALLIIAAGDGWLWAIRLDCWRPSDGGLTEPSVLI
jgi:hypothetical protein